MKLEQALAQPLQGAGQRSRDIHQYTDAGLKFWTHLKLGLQVSVIQPPFLPFPLSRIAAKVKQVKADGLMMHYKDHICCERMNHGNGHVPLS